MNTDKQAAQLWNSFYILTIEMQRFLKKNEINMFFSLLQQRMDLQKELEKLNNITYHKTDEGQELLQKIAAISLKTKGLAQSWLIRGRNKSNKVRSYDYMAAQSMGNIFNKKF